MGNSNNFMGNVGDEWPANMPNPADAWLDMRARLDEEMPVGGALPAPNGSIITVDNSLLHSVTLLFLLLLLGCPVLLFTGKNAGSNTVANQAVPAAGRHTLQPAATVNNKNKNTRPAAATANAARTTGTVNNYAGTTAANLKRRPNTARNTGRHKQPVLVTTGQPGQAKSNQASTSTGTAAAGAASPFAAYNILQQPAQKQQVQAGNKPGAADSSSNNKDDTDEEKMQWQAGLWWKAQVPFTGAKHYADGPNGKSQPYRLLIPGVWIAMQHGREMLDAELNLFAATVYKPQQFYSLSTVPVSQLTIDEKYKLVKTFGVSLGFGYNRNISGSWWAGGNVQFARLTAAENTIDSTITNTSTNNITHRSGTGKVNNNLWTNFNKFQVRIGAQIMYKGNKYQAGLRTGVYLMSPMSWYNTVHTPLETELFIRWGLWKWKK